jgi:hypothetical protein
MSVKFAASDENCHILYSRCIICPLMSLVPEFKEHVRQLSNNENLGIL